MERLSTKGAADVAFPYYYTVVRWTVFSEEFEPWNQTGDVIVRGVSVFGGNEVVNRGSVGLGSVADKAVFRFLENGEEGYIR